jgi:hypothetical protein
MAVALLTISCVLGRLLFLWTISAREGHGTGHWNAPSILWSGRNYVGGLILGLLLQWGSALWLWSVRGWVSALVALIMAYALGRLVMRRAQRAAWWRVSQPRTRR